MGFQAGLRRAEIAGLTVGDFRIDHGQHCLKFYKKGGEEPVLPFHAITVAALNKGRTPPASRRSRHLSLFLIIAGRKPEKQVVTEEGLFGVPSGSDPERACERVFPGREKNHAAHSMRATFITRALDAGAEPQEAHRAAGHANLETTMMYDRRSFDLRRAATLKTDYD